VYAGEAGTYLGGHGQSRLLLGLSHGALRLGRTRGSWAIMGLSAGFGFLGLAWMLLRL
jgi:hypothetical protein